MTTYKSGDLVIKFELMLTNGYRKHYHITAIAKDKVICDSDEYECYIGWDNADIAEDLVGWMCDTVEGVEEIVEYDWENSENENHYIVTLVS
jgi:hypothetical protein